MLKDYWLSNLKTLFNMLSAAVDKTNLFSTAAADKLFVFKSLLIYQYILRSFFHEFPRK